MGRERKVWVIEALPQNCRKGVHLHFSEELLSGRRSVETDYCMLVAVIFAMFE